MIGVTKRDIKKIYVRLALIANTGIDFFASLPIIDLLDYIEIIKEAEDKNG